jgi:hypothetical protein
LPEKPERLVDDFSEKISEVNDQVDNRKIMERFDRETEGQGLFYSLTHLNGHYFDG